MIKRELSILTIAYALLLPFSVKGEAPGLRISHLTGNFYVYTTCRDLNGFNFPSNSMYLVTEKGVVLFDTPWDTIQLQPLLDSIKSRHDKEVVLCIATHFHDDRTAGLEFYKRKGIATYTSKQTFDLGQERNEKQAEFCFINDTTFTVRDYQFETFYPGEGHSEDNIVIWFRKEKILYGGCFIKSCENKTLGNTADADLTEWEKSIKKVIKKFRNPEYVIPGHFGWEDKDSPVHTLQLLRKANRK